MMFATSPNCPQKCVCVQRNQMAKYDLDEDNSYCCWTHKFEISKNKELKIKGKKKKMFGAHPSFLFAGLELAVSPSAAKHPQPVLPPSPRPHWLTAGLHSTLLGCPGLLTPGPGIKPSEAAGRLPGETTLLLPGPELAPSPACTHSPRPRGAPPRCITYTAEPPGSASEPEPAWVWHNWTGPGLLSIRNDAGGLPWGSSGYNPMLPRQETRFNPWLGS